MQSLSAAAYLLLIVILGYTAMCVLFGKSHRGVIELLSPSFAAGSGILPAILFLLSLAGFIPGRMILVTVAIISIALLTFLFVSDRLILISPRLLSKSTPAWKFLAALAIAIIAICTLNVLARATERPRTRAHARACRH